MLNIFIWISISVFLQGYLFYVAHSVRNLRRHTLTLTSSEACIVTWFGYFRREVSFPVIREQRKVQTYARIESPQVNLTFQLFWVERIPNTVCVRQQLAAEMNGLKTGAASNACHRYLGLAALFIYTHVNVISRSLIQTQPRVWTKSNYWFVIS